jgi:SnoaL-like domain
MASMTETAMAFFDACETGKGWEGCAAHCTPGASFAAQAEPLVEVRTLKDYAEWM